MGDTSTFERDAELVRRFQQGDRNAFGELVRLHARSVLALCRRAGLQEADAEDLCQEIFLQTYLDLHSLRQPLAFAAWLKRLAGRKCRAWRERRGQRPLGIVVSQHGE